MPGIILIIMILSGGVITNLDLANVQNLDQLKVNAIAAYAASAPVDYSNLNE